MIVSETRQFVFIHNPKCGGTGVRLALMRHDTTGDFFWGYDEILGRKIDKAHMPMHVFRQAYPSYFRLLETSFVFMLVRNPYERALSSFNEIRRRLIKESVESKLLFEEQHRQRKRAAYVDAVNEYFANLDPQHLSGWEAGYQHFIRQRDMAFLGRKNMADCIIKLENLEHESIKLGMFDAELRRAVVATEKKNESRFMSAGEVFNEATVRKINELYRDDFDLFDYERW